jgi:hypothetical protein
MEWQPGMGMDFAGRENEKDGAKRGEWEWQPGMGMGIAGRENEKDNTERGEWEWQNTEWQPTPYRINK